MTGAARVVVAAAAFAASLFASQYLRAASMNSGRGSNPGGVTYHLGALPSFVPPLAQQLGVP
jgi:hypothetical protein